MRTPTRLVSALVGALLLAACGTSSGGTPADVAATVNGDTVTVADLEEQVRLRLASPEFAQVPADQKATATEQAQQQALSSLIQQRLIEAEIDRRGITATDEEVQDLYDQEAASRGGQEQFDAFLVEIGLTDEEAREFLASQVRQDKLQAELEQDIEVTDAEVREAFAEREDTLETVASAHILLEDEATANEVRALLDGGADFAQLAEERSTGPSGPQGGELGDVPTSQLVPEYVAPLRDAQPGDIVGPFETQFGWHVVRFDGFTSPSFEDVREQIETELRSSRANGVIQSFVDELNAGDITVNSRFGRWDAVNGVVLPPEEVGSGSAPAGSAG